jgi:DNA-binding response OmpR family regulator
MDREMPLQGQSILVVEDDYYLASDAARALQAAGADVLGPCATEEQAITLLDGAQPNAAVLDINLGAGPSFTLAHLLNERAVPLLFLSGYDDEVIPADFADTVKLQKPVELARMVIALANLTRR